MSEKVFGVTTEIRAIREKGVNQGSLWKSSNLGHCVKNGVANDSVAH